MSRSSTSSHAAAPLEIAAAPSLLLLDAGRPKLDDDLFDCLNETADGRESIPSSAKKSVDGLGLAGPGLIALAAAVGAGDPTASFPPGRGNEPGVSGAVSPLPPRPRSRVDPSTLVPFETLRLRPMPLS